MIQASEALNLALEPTEEDKRLEAEIDKAIKSSIAAIKRDLSVKVPVREYSPGAIRTALVACTLHGWYVSYVDDILYLSVKIPTEFMINRK